MLFPTVTFGVFLAVVLTANALLLDHDRRWKQFMLAASYVFYGWWDTRFLALVAGLGALNWFLGVHIGVRRDPLVRRRLTVVAVAADLAVLGFFKYYGFFAESLAGALEPAGITPPLPLLRIVLPIGISFLTFQAISYVVDVQRRDVAPAPLTDVALYLAFFPQLVAGPIVRAHEFLPQLADRTGRRRIDLGRAIPLIIAGLFKKVVVASYLASTLVDPVFDAPAAHRGAEVLLAIYGYAVQIYADFSGYTDIAIGVALLLGFRFPQNFAAPYRAVSLQDFWRRWHMTLSSWLRDYLYIPLGGSRRGRILTYRNLMLTMVLGGLWHGAAWTFVVWGALHGVWLALERLLVPHTSDGRVVWPGGPVVGWAVTFHVVCIGWVFFRADTVSNAWQLLGRLTVGWAPLTPTLVAVAAIVVAAVAIQVLEPLWERPRALLGRLHPAPLMTLAVGGLVVIDALGPEGVAPFIYFQF